MNDVKNPNTQHIVNTIVATVVAAGLIGLGQLVFSALNPRDALTASVSAARVEAFPEPFIEHMLNAGCDDTVQRGSDLASLNSYDARVRDCIATTSRVLNSV